jgi:hypothetical protein
MKLKKILAIALTIIAFCIMLISVYYGFEHDTEKEHGKFPLEWQGPPWEITNGTFAVTKSMEIKYDAMYQKMNYTIENPPGYTSFELKERGDGKQVLMQHHVWYTEIRNQTYMPLGTFEKSTLNQSYWGGNYHLFVNGTRYNDLNFVERFIYGFNTFIFLMIIVFAPCYLAVVIIGNGRVLIPRGWRHLQTKYPCPVCGEPVNYRGENQHLVDMVHHLNSHAEKENRSVTVTITVHVPKADTGIEFGRADVSKTISGQYPDFWTEGQ